MDALELFAEHLRRYIEEQSADDPELREVCLWILDYEIERMKLEDGQVRSLRMLH